MRLFRPALVATSALSLAAAALAPAAHAQDCWLPGSEEFATRPICNVDPAVSLDPPSTSTGQPVVPVTIVASDHYSDNNFGSFRIVLDGDTVTSQWSVVVTEGGWGTGRMKTFTARGTVTLSEHTLQVILCDVQFCTTPASTFTLRRPGVEVGEDGTSHVEPPASPHVKPFTVRNTGLVSATFTLTAECRDAQGQRVTPCSVSQPSISLAAGARRAVRSMQRSRSSSLRTPGHRDDESGTDMGTPLAVGCRQTGRCS